VSSTHYATINTLTVSVHEVKTPFELRITFLMYPSYFVNLLKSTGYVMHQQYNIQQLYALSTLYLCVLCLSENKQRLVPFTA
jgi:uncharacterized membrane protein